LIFSAQLHDKTGCIIAASGARQRLNALPLVIHGTQARHDLIGNTG